jgi:hypothetical protein
MSFSVGETYTRKAVQDLLGVPEDKRGGQWQNGYPRYQGQLYIFCNVDAAGRTGHDYPNSWDGGDLLWVGRTGANLRQPLMQQIATNAVPIHVFWRSNNANPQFTYRGLARALAAEDTIPARFRFGFPTTTAPISGPAQLRPRGGATLRQLLGVDGRLFAKSEFGPIHAGWPALSFSSRKLAGDFAQGFRRGRDFVLAVGTSDPSSTEDPLHRSRVLSAATLESKAPISTSQVVPSTDWEAAVAKWGRKWEWSLPVVAAYDFAPYPEARRVMPTTYSSLGNMANLGRCVSVSPDDLEALLDLPLVPVDLALRAAVRTVMAMNPTEPDVRKALSQLAMNIQQRIQLSGQERLGRHPMRKGPNLSDILAALGTKWSEQKGCCPLCGQPIPLRPTNRLLQMSPDRIDSDVKTYDPQNVHITHLGCNLAKSSGSMEEWQEYLAMIRASAATSLPF